MSDLRRALWRLSGGEQDDEAPAEAACLQVFGGVPPGAPLEGPLRILCREIEWFVIRMRYSFLFDML